MNEDIYTQACKDAESGDYVEAAKGFKQAADKGHTKAQYNLAICLHEGLGGYQAYMEAFYYFKKAADAGHLRAHYMLGCYFATGIAPYESLEEGIEHFRIAAEGGVADAQYNYGVHLTNEKRYEEALAIYNRACDQGHRDAAFNLGVLHAKGLGTPANTDLGAHFLEIAASKGHPEAASTLTQLLSGTTAPLIKIGDS